VALSLVACVAPVLGRYSEYLEGEMQEIRQKDGGCGGAETG